jgi:hypothetical protein
VSPTRTFSTMRMYLAVSLGPLVLFLGFVLGVFCVKYGPNSLWGGLANALMFPVSVGLSFTGLWLIEKMVRREREEAA